MGRWGSRERPIVTVTLNPAIDEAVVIDQFIPGATNRCQLDSLDPGGKGINASRVIHRLGRDTVALGFVGGVTGGMIRTRLDAEEVPHRFDDVSEMTRLNVMVYETATGRRTRLYLPGARVEPEALDRLRARLADLPPDSTVILAGSVPPGLPQTIYRYLVLSLNERGLRTIVDTSGAALESVLGAGPTLIKPNVEEAAAVLGRSLAGDHDVLRAAIELQRRGPVNVVISQGADGAIGVGPDGYWKAIPPSVEAVSTVGSGDSMVAGLAVALDEGEGLLEGLRLGTATGAATASTRGTRLCQPDDVEALLPRVVVTRLPDSLAA